MLLTDLISSLPEHRVEAGHNLIHQGDSCLHYFVVQTGRAKVFSRSAAGKEALLYHIAPGQICVLTTSCLLSQNHFPAEAVAETDMVLKMMAKRDFTHWMDQSSDFREFVFNSFSERISNLIVTVEKLAFDSIEVRLAKHLLLQPDHQIHCTHGELAVTIGSAREVVSRQLKRFEAKGWIQLGRGHINIVDRRALHQLI